MKDSKNHTPIMITKTNLFGVSKPFNRSTIVALSVGMSAVPSALGQINFDFPKTIFDPFIRVENFVVADFDQDGLTDLAVTRSRSIMEVYHHNADGTYTLQSVVDQGYFSLYDNGVNSNDLNGDGAPDLSWIVQAGNGVYFVEVAINNGNGSSWRIARLEIDRTVRFLEVGDIDGDGDNDIIVTTRDNCSGSYQYNCDSAVYVFENTGSEFLPPRLIHESLADTFDIFDIQLGDYDGDGDLDIADLLVDNASNEYYDKVYGAEIQILINDGSGEYSSNKVTTLPYANRVHTVPKLLKSADFDGDGDLDLAVVVGNSESWSLHAEFRIAVNDGIDQPFSITEATPFGHGEVRSVDAGDFDSDGRIDLVLTTPNDNGVFVFANNGHGFDLPASFPTGNHIIRQTVVRDMNNDGQLDILNSTDLSSNSLTVINNITLLDNPILETAPLIRGQQSQITISGLQPLEKAWVGITNQGWGNTVGIPLFGGLAFDLADMGIRNTIIQADNDGKAVFNWTVPSNAPLGPVVMQAGVHRGPKGKRSVKTPFVEAVIKD